MKTPLLPKYFVAVTAVFLLIAGGKSTGLGASVTITVGSPTDKFSPAVVSINTGDQVIWNWATTFHSTTSGTNGVAGDDNGVPSGSWNTGVITALPHSFTNTFTTPGNYAFFCSVHYASPNFMTGAVLVASSVLSPTVAITSPASNTVFAAPANVTVQATASEGGGAITNVQFLIDATVLTNQATTPYFATAPNLAANSYTLSAIASDSSGVTATSSVPISVVAPVTVSLSNSTIISGTNFQFTYLVNTGLSYVIQRAANLSSTNWISLVTNLAASNPAVFLDTHATNNPAFYRVGRMPNP